MCMNVMCMYFEQMQDYATVIRIHVYAYECRVNACTVNAALCTVLGKATVCHQNALVLNATTYECVLNVCGMHFTRNVIECMLLRMHTNVLQMHAAIKYAIKCTTYATVT